MSEGNLKHQLICNQSKIIMKKIIYLILILLCTASFAQERQIKGKVTSSDGEALPGAYLIEKGTDNGVISDFNGNYQITVSSSGATLTVSFIGFVGQEISIDDKKRIDFSLEELVRSLDDVVVIGFPGVVGKARKRTESVQSIPESVTAMNSKEIEKLGVNSVATFSNLVPNLKLSETQAVGVNSLIIRGIPQIRNSDAPVAFVIDGVTIPDPGLLNQELFDVALIEVVKGPQGALYGKNAIGGAINIYSKEPTNDFKNKLTLGYGNGNSYDARFISSGALKEDKLFYRVSTQYKNFDGLLNNEFLDKKVDFNQDFTIRGQLMAEFTDNFKGGITIQYIDKKAGATYYSVNPTGGTSGTPGGFVLDPNPNDGNSIISQDVFGESDMKNLYSNLNFEYIFNKVKLKSITSFNNVDRSTIGDLDFTQDVVLDQGETNDTKSFNQEFRLENIVSDSKIDWSVGGFYQNIERTFFQSDLTFSSTFAVTDYVATFNTFALFGFLDYHLTDKLTASAGLRFDSDEFGLEDFLNNQTDKKKDNVLQPKASLAYQANKDVLFYGNYGRGYRAGGFNPKITPEFNRDFKGEISDNFEIGIKTSWWNNRFIINGAVFYSDFTNRQQFWN